MLRFDYNSHFSDVAYHIPAVLKFIHECLIYPMPYKQMDLAVYSDLILDIVLDTDFACVYPIARQAALAPCGTKLLS